MNHLRLKVMCVHGAVSFPASCGNGHLRQHICYFLRGPAIEKGNRYLSMQRVMSMSYCKPEV